MHRPFCCDPFPWPYAMPRRHKRVRRHLNISFDQFRSDNIQPPLHRMFCHSVIQNGNAVLTRIETKGATAIRVEKTDLEKG